MKERELYEQEVGEPHELPEDHPFRWQWEYRGTKAEQEALMSKLELPLEDEDEILVIEGQEELF